MIIKRYTTANLIRVFTVTNGSATIFGGNTEGIIAGTSVSGTGIPGGATVLNVINPTTFTLSVNATVSGNPSLTFSGTFEKEHPQTKAQMIRNQSDSDNIFDNNDKLKLNYLPNAVFDSLYFSSNAGPSALNLRVQDALKDAITVNRSALGFYWVVSTAGDFTASSTATFNTLYSVTFTRTASSITLSAGTTTGLAVGMYISGTGITPGTTITGINNASTITISQAATASGSSALSFGYTLSTRITGGEEGQAATFPTTVKLEIGDWFVISKITGLGSSADPLIVTFAIINNVYETMTGATSEDAGAPGLVPLPAANDHVKFLQGNGTWGVPTGTYAHPTDGANSTITAAAGLVLSAITVNTLGHVTSVESKTLATTDIPTLNQDTTGTAANVTGTVAIANGGTGAITASTGFDALSPMTTLGDTVYGGTSGTGTRLVGNTTATKQFLSQTGTGSASAAPVWSALAKGDVGLGNVENTALSTWAGSSNITTLGTIATGTWSGTAIAIAKGGTGATTALAGFNALSPMSAAGDILYGGTSGSATVLVKGTAGQVLKMNAGATAPVWAADNDTTYGATNLGGLSVASNNFRMNHPLFIQTATPSTPLAGTVWFDIN